MSLCKVHISQKSQQKGLLYIIYVNQMNSEHVDCQWVSSLSGWKNCGMFYFLAVYWLFSRTYMGGYDSPFKTHVSSYGYDLQGILSECCGHPDLFDGFTVYGATE